MTKHINGTNGRTFCGYKKSNNTVVAENDLDATCKNCLGRLAQDRDYMFNLLMKLRDERIARTYG